MLNNAFRKARNTEGLIYVLVNTGSTNTDIYQQALKMLGIVHSMSRKGNYLDNTIPENFSSIMKSELLYADNFCSTEELIYYLKKYIYYYYNKRIISWLNRKSLAQ